MSRNLYGRLARRYGPRREGLSRRELLQASLAASAGLLLSSCTTFPRSGGKNGPRVIVVGAGFAGLACAHELLAARYDVTVIEARPRASGRVSTLNDFVPGKAVERGGEYIGENHPLWWAYSKRFKLELRKAEEDDSLGYPVMLEGKKLSDEESTKLYEELETAYGPMTEDAKAVVADTPWTTKNAAALDARTTAEWIASLEVSPLCKRAIATELTCDNGVSVTRQSYLGNLSQVKGGGLEKYWTDSETHRCVGGNQRLADAFVNAIGADRIKLNTVVASIDVSPTEVNVRTADGQVFVADHVVLTVPPTVWGRIAISPALPAALTPQMGRSVKYLSKVDAPYWLDDKLASAALTDGDVGMTWDATEGQPGDSTACLTAFSSAEAADRVRNMPPADRQARYAAILEELYPGYAKHRIEARFIDWPSDPWTGGGYSFPAPGQVTTVGPLLHKGMGRLHFAGEHTCYKFVGYMEGALQSGAAAAKRIANRTSANAGDMLTRDGVLASV